MKERNTPATETAKVTKPAQTLNKDPAKLRLKMPVVPPLAFISSCCILEGLIFVKFGDTGLMETVS